MRALRVGAAVHEDLAALENHQALGFVELDLDHAIGVHVQHRAVRQGQAAALANGGGVALLRHELAVAGIADRREDRQHQQLLERLAPLAVERAHGQPLRQQAQACLDPLGLLPRLFVLRRRRPPARAGRLLRRADLLVEHQHLPVGGLASDLGGYPGLRLAHRKSSSNRMQASSARAIWRFTVRSPMPRRSATCT